MKVTSRMRPRLRTLLLLGLVVAAWWIVQASGLHEHLTLAALQAQHTTWQTQVAAHPWESAATFLTVYVLVTALSVPGATILTLAAGALFGLLAGTVLVSLASTAGATLAMLSARYLLRERVRSRWGTRLADLDRRFAERDVEALLSLRLLPVMPFFVLNLLVGLTAMPVRRFAWVSQLGMLPATLAYVNAGTQLAQIESVAGVLSPALWLSMALLATFPWLTRSGWARYSAWRRLRPWAAQKPRPFDRNLIVIGAGAAGLVSSYIAAAVKAKVTLVEAQRMGGDCLNTGCVPSKALIASARVAHTLRQAQRWGIDAGTGNASVNFPEVMRRVREVICEIEPHDSIERYTRLGVDVRQGRARLVNPWTVAITSSDGESQTLTARSIVLATGAAPRWPDLPGIDQVNAHSSDTVWEHLSTLDQAPKRVLILGGGPIACELGQTLQRLGSQVTLLLRGEQLLSGEDWDVSQALRAQLEAEGVKVVTRHVALRCERGSNASRGIAEGAVSAGPAPLSTEGDQHLIADHQGQTVNLPFDLLLVAMGREPRWEGLGLEALGLLDADGRLPVNEHLQTRLPHILVAGDAAGGRTFTHLAAHHAWTAAVNGLFGHLWRLRNDERVMPTVTFTAPEIARVGLNIREAEEQGIAHDVHRYELTELDRAITDGHTEGWVQVLTPPGKDRILGVTVVGARAGDMLSEFTLAMRHGLGLNAILATIHPYPTWAEANKAVAGQWKRAHAPQRLLTLLARWHDWRRG
jgi:pyruvate/2-oxoglutarate dehydrogenase complex dihydrolipoamide dehydrogenase (E3) component/uncharacterized membrane protein YdjX (TVP38/TMEM64 family)